MNPHDEIVSKLLEYSIELRLVGRVADPVLGNDPDPKEVFLFVPDLHLLTPERQAAFGTYGFNHGDLLGHLLQGLASLRSRWDSDGTRKLVTVQLGDFFDLWREFPKGADLGSIDYDVHGDLRDVLYRGIEIGRPCLKATMLLGNHDSKRGVHLQEPGFRLTFFNRSAANRPFLFATHGDAFAVLEILVPDAVKGFVVNLLGQRTPSYPYTLVQWGKAAAKDNKTMAQLEDSITEPLHALHLPGGSPGASSVTPGANLPAILAREVTSAADAEHKYFTKFYESVERAQAANYDAGSVRVVVIGHTHHARMILCRPANQSARPLILMDVGAWIENCSYALAEGGSREEASAQLGVIHGNDARIYQVHKEP